MRILVACGEPVTRLLLQSTIGKLKAGKDAQPSPKPPVPTHVRKPGLYVCDKDAPQASLEWVVPGLRRTDEEWHAAMVMNHVLGGSFTGRLMKRIRSDEGLTYGVRTSLGEGAYWRGDLTGSLQTKNRSVAYAFRLALEEMKRLQTEAIPAARQSASRAFSSRNSASLGSRAVTRTAASASIRLGRPV